MRCLLVRDVAFLRHERQDDGHALGAGLGVIDGIIGRRRLRKSCKHGALGKVELLRLLAKVRVAGFPEAVCPVTEVNGIEVELKDFLLRVVAVKLDGKGELFDLAAHCALRREENVLDRLLVDRAAAFERFACHVVRHHRAGDADRIHGAMVIEAAVFGRNDTVDEVLRDVLEWNEVLAVDAGFECFLEIREVVVFLAERLDVLLLGDRCIRCVLGFIDCDLAGIRCSCHAGCEGGNHVRHLAVEGVILLGG